MLSPLGINTFSSSCLPVSTLELPLVTPNTHGRYSGIIQCTVVHILYRAYWWNAVHCLLLYDMQGYILYRIHASMASCTLIYNFCEYTNSSSFYYWQVITLNSLHLHDILLQDVWGDLFNDTNGSDNMSLLLLSGIVCAITYTKCDWGTLMYNWNIFAVRVITETEIFLYLYICSQYMLSGAFVYRCVCIFRNVFYCRQWMSSLTILIFTMCIAVHCIV